MTYMLYVYKGRQRLKVFSHMSVLIRFEYCLTVMPSLKHVLVGEEGYSGFVKEYMTEKASEERAEQSREVLVSNRDPRQSQTR